MSKNEKTNEQMPNDWHEVADTYLEQDSYVQNNSTDNDHHRTTCRKEKIPNQEDIDKNVKNWMSG